MPRHERLTFVERAVAISDTAMVMNSSSRHWACLLAVVVLALQATGMHVHLAEHGESVTQDVHFASHVIQHAHQHEQVLPVGLNAGSEDLSHHEDTEVDLDNIAVSKTADFRGDGLGLVFVLATCLVLSLFRAPTVRSVEIAPSLGKLPFFLRPPLRGPPTPIIH